MAAELPRPGVEIIQEFQSATPTILRPTLVPFVCGAAKEIVEVTTADGLLNAAARQGAYEQLPRVISQTSFPSPRDNIAEVDVEESTIKVFFQFGGALRELERDPGESFLVAHNHATRPALRSSPFVTGTGLDLNGKILILALDVTARLNRTEDVTITFASSGGNLTPDQIVDQINDAMGEEIASVITIGSDSRIQISSLNFGASASITARGGGSANTTFGFSDAANEHRVEGSGFRAQDQNNNTTLSPWIEWSKGSYQIDGTHQNSLPTYDDTIPTAAVGAGFVDADDEFDASYVQGSTAFTGVSSLDLKVGDEFFADGTQPNTAVIMKVEAARFKLGTVNTKLSVFDDDGKLVSAVYDSSNVNTLFSSTPFAPRYAWFMAKNLEVGDVATSAILTGATSGSPAETATIEAPGVATYPVALAGLTLEVDVTVDGVEMDTQTFTFTGGPFANVAAVVAAIADNIDGVFAHTNLAGTHLALSTDLTGAGQALTVRGTSTALAALGFVAATTYSDTGTDVEVVDINAVLLGTAQTFPFTAVVGETLIVQVSTDGGSTWTMTRTFTHASAGPHADIVALLAALNTAGNWDGAALPTQFVIDNVGNQLRITSDGEGSLTGIRIGSASTGIGVTADSELGFTSLQTDLGEENLNGQTLQFKLNNRDKTYSVLFTSDSLVDAVEAINEAVGWPVASIGGDDDDQLVLTSTLTGYASQIDVTENETTTRANAALGFGTGNRSASGTGRPNPDFYIDVSGSVVLGAEVLRSVVTGDPFDPGTSDVYIQYTGLRKDVSPVAAEPGLLRISDVATLATVLSPIRSDNPLGFGMFFTLINAPTLECTGLGVDEISASEPYGTPLAFTRCANFIESEEIYAIAPLTHSETVAQIFKTHVETMSGPEQKGERVLVFCPAVPDRRVDDIVVSGLSGNTTATPNQFVVDVNPVAGLVDRDLDPGLLTYEDQVFLELVVTTSGGSEVRNYLVSSVSGTLVTVTTEFEDDENEDGFFSVETLSETLVNADWKMAVRGSKLLIAGSTLPDKDKIAETIAAKASAYKQRRMVYVFPDQVRASTGGTEELIPGFYACAGIVGMVAKFPPQQGFTNLPMTGYSGVVGSNDTYSVKQLNVMAGGGAYILVQEAQGAPLISRHQLTTNLTSIETREFSITKVVDFTAKFLRSGLRNFIGTFNITQPFLDTLSTVIQGMLGFLVENGVILGGDLNNLIQSKDAPDTVLVDVTLDVPFPCNYIRLTLVI